MNTADLYIIQSTPIPKAVQHELQRLILSGTFKLGQNLAGAFQRAAASAYLTKSIATLLRRLRLGTPTKRFASCAHTSPKAETASLPYGWPKSRRSRPYTKRPQRRKTTTKVTTPNTQKADS